MNSFSFNVEKFVYTQKDTELDLSFIPANIRRKLNIFDKHVLYLINNCFTQDVENIILSSQFGEFDRLLKLIEQYEEFNEVSPMVFSSSVHNYALGQFSLLNKVTIPTVSIAGGVDSFEAGFISTIADSKKNVIYTYVDNLEGNIAGLGFRINNNQKGFVVKKCVKTKPESLEDAVKFFNNEKELFKFSNYTIGRGF